MAEKDGDGWARCDRGHQHWGVHGAAGLLAVHHTPEGPFVLMQKRSWWSHHGGTWGLPGGARDSHEDAISSALREAHEEAALVGDLLRVQGVYLDDHGGWSFHTVIAEAAELLQAAPANSESVALSWVSADRLNEKKLHPGFAETWPLVRPTIDPVVLVLDMANIIGARAEHGWWRDRAGAATRLLVEVSSLADRGLQRQIEGLPDITWRYPRIVAVVEGAARAATPPPLNPALSVLPAPGSGDDAIVEVVRAVRPWERALVITADRGLRDRVTGLGALVVGPSWLLAQL
ncbi:NTP pyrophosphohydrolase [Acrocarpospora corrugata]|uniref:NTP pyrophosphohydrolase n=1 Tax=Acrocarpospora corrugata TaxID=35763 RepID=A0A5M3WBK5_9ACTN|nr:NUDIX hydrolase [Acrocarpospora corrugata]GES05610.1 NTP pyrophosphohydrolase [Acrocarpospora corrugata]